MKQFTSRQPIFDKHKIVKAYQINFSAGFSQYWALATQGLARQNQTSNLNLLASNKSMMVHLTEAELTEDILAYVDQKKFFIDLSHLTEASPDLLEKCRRLYHLGYRFCFNDDIFLYEWEAYLPFAKMIKFSISQTPLNTLEPLMPFLKQQKTILLADDIDNHEQYELCRSLGFHLFRGEFFCKPEIIEHNTLTNDANYVLSIYTEAMRETFNIKRLAELFAKDLTLTYKLFKYVNACYFNKKESISSIKQALAFLGENAVKKLICIIATTYIQHNKPAELVTLSISRSRFCESLAANLKLNPDFAFIVGLFSVLNAILDQSMENILSKLALNPSVKTALLSRTNQYGMILKICELYEKAQWSAVNLLAGKMGLDPDILPKIYQESIKSAYIFENLE
ncbi:EAL and HDOD domain-containing protein [Catenovulum maritimum]|uniref:HDOD domain-containing protein n=1 Tax=Catenovulum maritimum TaxID=1513271 RepID=A0A0J8GTU8_9ALTE|nr:HDOD domain-containing protein [Catenovulum maritimum]KMT64113.1 hypothetical protein XM47_16145 [Catenovulum maritimum]